MITKEEHLIWKDNETTQKVFKMLEAEIELIEKSWSSGAYFQDALVNAKQIGVIEGINKVLFMEVDDEE